MATQCSSPSRIERLPSELRLLIYGFLGYPTIIDVERNEPDGPKKLSICENDYITFGADLSSPFSPPSATASTGRRRPLKGSKFFAGQAIVRRGALSLLKTNKFFFSELCPLLYRETVLVATLDSIPLLKMANRSRESSRSSPGANVYQPSGKPMYDPFCLATHAYSFQHIPHVILRLPAWHPRSFGPCDAHYLNNMLTVLRRSVSKLGQLLQSLRKIFVLFPWGQLEQVEPGIRTSFLQTLGHLICTCPKLQKVMLMHGSKGLWIGFLNREQLWERLDPERVGTRGDGGPGDEMMESVQSWRSVAIGKCLVEIFQSKPWVSKDGKEKEEKRERLAQIIHNTPLYTTFDFDFNNFPGPKKMMGKAQYPGPFRNSHIYHSNKSGPDG
ncbi:MAG: hypothetical protein M1821_005822 [Bathelium mastoideum]|nr:MAG: hypothetical protein M1821_005822 [Bathelium mastoideum]